MKKATLLIMFFAQMFFAQQILATDYSVIIKCPAYISGQATSGTGNPFAVLVGIVPDTTGEDFVGRCRIGSSSTTAGNNHFHWQDSTAWDSGVRNTWGGDLAAYYNSRHIASADSGETTKVWFITKCDTTPQSQYILARIRRLVDTTVTGSNRDSPRQIVTVMDMTAQGAWVEGHVYSDPSYSAPLANYVVLAYRADTIVGSYITENNTIVEGYDSGDPGYVMFTAPAGTIDSFKVRDMSDNPVNFYVKSTPPWNITAGDTTNFDILPNVPTIIYTSPANNAANVAINSPITIGFNKAINPTSFAYSCSTGTAGWSVSWNGAGDTATLTHANFSYVTTYKFQVTAAKDLSNNDLVPGPKPNPFRFATQPDPATIPLKIICLDVGQGDATLVLSPSGKSLLFDAGETGKGYGKIWPFLRDSVNLHHLDYTAVNHYHEDHIGGMDEVIDSLGGSDSILSWGYDRGGTYASTAFTDYAAALGAKRKTIGLGQVIDLGSGVSAKCVAVNGQTYGDNISPSDENDYGVGLLIQYGGFRMIVSGDLGGYNSGGYKDVESILAPDIGKVSVLHANHHGSQYSSNPYWVSTLDPRVSVISVGNNGYGHPTQLALDRLCNDPGANNYIYQTELGSGGTIPAGRGEVVGSNIWIEVTADTFTVNSSDKYPNPVQLSFLTASADAQGRAEIKWRTESEKDCDRWEVERTDDPSARYVMIGETAGNGTTNQPSEYIFTDPQQLPAGDHYYRIAQYDFSGTITYYGPVKLPLDGGGLLPAEFKLGSNYPNPFSQATVISYQTASGGPVNLSIYNVAGQLVRTLVNENRGGGKYQAAWDGKDGTGKGLPNGVYLFRLSAEGASVIRKMMLIR
ncbi:MAG: Ig-like domain-containing protein [Candidatus Edwardsbacteria bacterium]|nr:Ig-like domain-containing protein [Candidatus Edwardsbacteria bacterium]